MQSVGLLWHVGHTIIRSPLYMIQGWHSHIVLLSLTLPLRWRRALSSLTFLLGARGLRNTTVLAKVDMLRICTCE